MISVNPKVDAYLADGCGRCSLYQTPECKVHRWTNILTELRRIVNECMLIEELKWGQPCYTFNNSNVLIMSAFKNYSFLSFIKGVLLSDPKSKLENLGPNSQSTKQWRFTDVKDVIKNETLIKSYIFEAIEIEKAGLKVEFKKNPEPIPDELLEMFDKDPAFEGAFNALSPGRQRGYILHFSQAKQSATRTSRIEKCMAKIFKGEGMNDGYKKAMKK